MRTSRALAWIEMIHPYLTAKNKKSLCHQAREILHLANAYKRLPDQYLKCGLYCRHVPGRVVDYMSPKMLMPYIVSTNCKSEVEVERNKVHLRRVLGEVGIPVVKELFSIEDDGVISDYDGQEIDVAQARALLECYGGAVFVKPLRGTWGAGAYVLAPDAIPTDFPEGLTDRVIQPVIEQHPNLDALYSSAVNTVRIDTLKTERGVIHNAAVLRIGTGGATVDNGSSGGLVVGLDLETGQLRRFARKKPHYSNEWFEHHPDTGFRFADLVIPFWNELKSLVVRAADHLPFGSLGWDIAITPEGPLIVEANSYWDVTLMQLGSGGLGGTELGRRVRRYHQLSNSVPSTGEPPSAGRN